MVLLYLGIQCVDPMVLYWFLQLLYYKISMGPGSMWDPMLIFCMLCCILAFCKPLDLSDGRGKGNTSTPGVGDTPTSLVEGIYWNLCTTKGLAELLKGLQGLCLG